MPPIYSLLQALMDRQNVDLGRIPIIKPQILPQGLTPTNPMPQNTMTPTLPTPTQSLQGGAVRGQKDLSGSQTARVADPNSMAQAQTPGGSALSAFLRQVGLPLGAAAIGSIFPQALPGAAGFSQGFATEQSKLREKQIDTETDYKKENQNVPLIVIGEDGKPEIVGYIPKNSVVRNQKGGLDLDLGDLGISKDEQGNFNIPQSKSTEEIKSGVEANYTDEDLEFTAKKYGISVEEVKKRLGQ